MRAVNFLMAIGAAAAALFGGAQSTLAQSGDMLETSPTNLLINFPSERARPHAKLAPLALDSPWRVRFEAVADDLLPALQSRDAHRWQPMLGGRWLSPADRQAVAVLLADKDGAYAPVLAARTPLNRRILGWSVSSDYSAADRAAILAQPEAEAILCWSAQALDDGEWPQTAAAADNARGRPYACARVTYSMRGEAPVWRAFVESPHLAQR